MGKAKKAKAKAAGQLKAGVAKRMQGNKKKQRKNSNFNARSGASAGVGVAAAYAKGLSSGEPMFMKMSRAGVVIRHRELVASITGSATFTVAATLALNPGLAATFPWLSTQAVGWEQYRFKKLKFCYYTRTATSTPGSMLLVPDYDAADAAPASEQIASTYRDVEEEVPWIEEFSCNLDPLAMHPDGNRKFVRTGPLAANLDIKLSDVGNMFACTTDGTITNWGKLWVEYECEFFVPQLPPTGAFNQVGTLLGATGTAANPVLLPVAFGGIPLTIAGQVVTATGLVIGQEYLIGYGGTTNVNAPGIGTLVGLTLKNTFVNSTNVLSCVSVTATAATANFTITAGAGIVVPLLFVVGVPTMTA